MTQSKETTLKSRTLRFLSGPMLNIILPLLLVAIAFYALQKLANHVRWSEVRSDIATTPETATLLALGWMAVSYVAISFYDVLSVRSVAGDKVPARVAALVGASGYAISNMLGFAYFTGTAVRYRAYSALGLTLPQVAGIAATSWSAFWMGLLLLLGGLLTFHPTGVSQVIAISRGTETAIGAALLLFVGGLFGWLARGGKRLSLAGYGFDLPSARTTLLLTGVSILDIIGATLTLYVLIPADLIPNFPYFFVVYITAIALGVLSHAPGGIGVFEATVVAGLSAAGRADVLAALVVYRLIYSILPFAVAAAGIGVAWFVAQRTKVQRAASWTFRLARPIVPVVSAGISLLAGMVLLVSGNLPAEPTRLGILRDILPLSFIEASHLAGSVTGLLLIVIARGLYRKLYRAWAIAMALMVLGLAVSLAKGLDWKEALSMLATCLVLGSFRSAFYRVEGASVFRLNGPWFVTITALLAITVWIGLFAYSNVPYRDTMWWQFALRGDASRFLRATLAGAVILTVIGVNSMISGQSRRGKAPPIPGRIRELLAESEDAEAQLALTGDKEFLISKDRRAFLAYADSGGSLIAKGDPVGAPDAGKTLIWELRERADRAGKRCAFYAVSPKYLPTYLDLGLSILKIGEVARVNLKGFTLEGPVKKDFRHAKSRALREDFEFAVIPATDIAAHLPELQRISDAWLESKQGEEKTFALGAFEESYLVNFDHAVLKNSTTGEIVAFANLFQSANRHEVCIDLMRYDPLGPKFAMDALMGELMLWATAQGFAWFSLGAAPFAGIERHRLASWWNRFSGFIYQHGESFYHFEGLRTFKQKFDPVWTPSYLASPGGFAVPRVLYEVNVLVSGGIKGLIK